MIPSVRVALAFACIAASGCTVAPPKPPTTTETNIYSVYDGAKGLMGVRCVGTKNSDTCPIQVDRGAQRLIFSLAVGKGVAFADRPKNVRVCVATEVTKTAGCPELPPPSPPPPPPRQS